LPPTKIFFEFGNGFWTEFTESTEFEVSDPSETILSTLLILSESDSSTEFTESAELPAPLDFLELILSILLILSDNKKAMRGKTHG